MYKIGDKVKTNKGIGIIVAFNGYEEPLYIVEINNIGTWGFNEHQLKPYRTEEVWYDQKTLEDSQKVYSVIIQKRKKEK